MRNQIPAVVAASLLLCASLAVGQTQYTIVTVPAIRAGIGGPVSLAEDAAGNVYAADVNRYRVSKIAPDGTCTTVAAISSKSNCAGLCPNVLSRPRLSGAAGGRLAGERARLDKAFDTLRADVGEAAGSDNQTIAAGRRALLLVPALAVAVVATAAGLVAGARAVSRQDRRE